MSELVPSAARFSNRVSDYARYRPSYPVEAIDALFAGIDASARPVAVDVGAGTGISARLLAARGAAVIALEPNPLMRAAIADERIEVRDAVATETGIATASADLVTAFQAFHWFANEEATREFARILKPGGRVAFVWNARDDDDAFTREYGDVADAPESMAAGARGPYGDYVPGLLAAAGFEAVRAHTFANAQRLDLDGLVGRAHSASYVPLEGPEAEAIDTALRALFARFAAPDGTVALAYRTHVFTATRPLS